MQKSSKIMVNKEITLLWTCTFTMIYCCKANVLLNGFYRVFQRKSVCFELLGWPWFWTLGLLIDLIGVLSSENLTYDPSIWLKVISLSFHSLQEKGRKKICKIFLQRFWLIYADNESCFSFLGVSWRLPYLWYYILTKSPGKFYHTK